MYSVGFERYNRPVQRYNLIRCIELILCSICLGLAIYILIEIPRVYLSVKAILLLTSGAYFFITLVDVITTCTLKPILWSTWIMFSIIGALMFFLCSGFIVFRKPPINLILYVITTVMLLLTAILFLVDTFYFAFDFLESQRTETNSCKSCKSSVTPSIKSASTTSKTRGTDKESQAGCHQGFAEDKCVQFPSNAVLRKGKYTCTRDTCISQASIKRAIEESPIPPSHGGTFHVSKDVAPLLTPSTAIPHTPKTCPSNCASPSSSKHSKNTKICFDPDGIVIAKTSQDSRGNLIEEALTVKSRTVSTSARMIPKKSENTCLGATASSDLYPEKLQKSTEDECSKNRQRPQSTPVADSSCAENPLPRAYVHHYYNCACPNCGQAHRHIATVQTALPHRSACSAREFRGLPTVNENQSGTSKSQASKDPYPSPAAIGSSSQSSPDSYSPPCKDPKCTCLPLIKYYQNSDFDTDTTASSPKPSARTESPSAHSPSSYQSSLSSKIHPCRKCPKRRYLQEQYIYQITLPWQTNEENKMRVAVNQDVPVKEAKAHLLLEPNKKGVYTQTQQYGWQEETTNITNENTMPMTNFSDWDEHPCKDQSSLPRKIAPEEKTELETVLPGAITDQSAGEPIEERKVLQPLTQEPTIIDMTTPSDATVIYLAPTECHNNSSGNTRRNKRCTIL